MWRLFGACTHGLWLDGRATVRRLSQERASSFAIVVILGLGIGPATVAYATFNHLLFRPVPGMTEPGNVIAVRFTSATEDAGIGNRTAVPAMREAAASVGLEKLAAEGWSETLAVQVGGDSQLSVESVGFVFGQYFDALGVKPLLGRLMSDEEAEAVSSSVAVVSSHFWQKRLGGSRSVVGQTIRVAHVPFVVIGVADGFRGFGRYASRVGETDIWLPVASARMATGVPVPTTTTRLMGRIRPDASVEHIEERLRAAYGSLAWVPQDWRLRTKAPLEPTVSMGLGRHDARDASALRLFWWSLGLTGALLLIAGVNAGGLLISRFSRRRADMMVRLAIGASRFRLIRQYLLETAVLASLGGGLSVVAALTVVSALGGVRLSESLPALSGMEFDARVLIFVGLATLSTVFVAGVLPSLNAPPRDIRLALAQSGQSVTRPGYLGHIFLIVGVAVSTVLALGAGVMGRSLRNLAAADLGANLDGVLELVLEPHRLLPRSEQPLSFYDDVLDRLREAGLTRVATSHPEPLSGNSRKMTFRVEGETIAVTPPREYSVSRGLFDLLGMPMTAGRDFTEEEVPGRPDVQPMPVVVNESLAAALFPSAPPIGREFYFDRVGSVGSESDRAVVIGVVRDVREANVRVEPRPIIYHTRPTRVKTILVKARGAAPLRQIEEAVRTIAPTLPITTLRPLADRVEASMGQDRTLAVISGLVAVQAVLLAGFGVLAMVTQLVSERTREFGIRSALGASRTAIVLRAGRQAMGGTVAGMAAGLGAYWLLSRLVESMLYQVAALDLATCLVVAIVILATTTVSAIVPAYRAAASDPLAALRVG